MGGIKEALVVSKILGNKFITYIPLYSLLAALLLAFNWDHSLAFIFAFGLGIKLMSSPGSEFETGNHLSLVKSLPLKKGKVAKWIVATTMFSIISSISIILLVSFISPFLGFVDHNMKQLIFALFAILLPVLITVIFWVLPTAVLRGYIPNKQWVIKIVQAYLLLFTGAILAGVGEYSTRYLWVWVVISTLFYYLAVTSIKKTYNYVMYLLTDPLRS